MYQVTFIRDGALHAVSTPSIGTAGTLRDITTGSRLWVSCGKGQWALVR